jgi:hypothetical protein
VSPVFPPRLAQQVVQVARPSPRIRRIITKEKKKRTLPRRRSVRVTSLSAATCSTGYSGRAAKPTHSQDHHEGEEEANASTKKKRACRRSFHRDLLKRLFRSRVQPHAFARWSRRRGRSGDRRQEQETYVRHLHTGCICQLFQVARPATKALRPRGAKVRWSYHVLARTLTP